VKNKYIKNLEECLKKVWKKVWKKSGKNLDRKEKISCQTTRSAWPETEKVT
jgi:hypothetical protein